MSAGQARRWPTPRLARFLLGQTVGAVSMLSKFLSAAVFAAAAQAVSIHVASSGGNATSPYAYGLMFEDINNSGDGGVYAELIQNRAFQGDSVSILYRDLFGDSQTHNML